MRTTEDVFSRQATSALRAALLALFLVSPLPAAADWLVLGDGSRLETRGAVKVDGRRVKFTDLEGRFVALRTDEVDLEATEIANRPPAPKRADGFESPGSGSATPPEPAKSSPAAARPTASRAPVVRLTDADFAHVDDIDSPAIAFYTTSWCGWCRKSRELLDELRVAYRELDVEEDAAAALEKERLAPGSGVPVIAFRDDVLTGYSEAGIRRLASEWRLADRSADEAREASRRPVAEAPQTPRR